MAKSKRSVAREKATIGIYQHLLVDIGYEDILNYLETDSLLSKDERSLKFSINIVKAVLENQDQYEEEISRYLKKGWNWSRIGYMERAILLVAAAELLDLDTEKKVAINEAVENAKTYCDEDSYKFINGILANII